jgi:uncharacterized protein
MRALLVLVFCLLPRAVSAQPSPPELTQPVNDFAHVIDAESAREMDRRIRALQQQTGDTIVVATVKTFQPYASIDEYAVRMFQNGGRGVGERGKDNGVLVVVAVDDRQVRIEVGYALEEFVTDGYAGETIRNTILPEFRRNAYGRGLLAGVTRLINRVASARGVTIEDVPAEREPIQPPSEFSGAALIFVGWIVLMILMSIANRRNRRRRGRFWGGGPWSGWNSGVGPFGGGGFGGGFGGFGGGLGGGGGGGGGFGGFGGGRSGGGGASGGW